MKKKQINLRLSNIKYLKREKTENPTRFVNSYEAQKYVELNRYNGSIIQWSMDDDNIVGTEFIRCLYCNEWETKPDGEGEHILPKSLGSPFCTVLVSKKCNDFSNEEVDKHFNTSDIVKFLLAYTGLAKRFNINNSFLVEIEKRKYPYRVELINKEIIYTPLNPKVDYPSISPDFSITKHIRELELKIIIKEMMKIIFGFTSLKCPGFRDTPIADEMYKFVFYDHTPEEDKLKFHLNHHLHFQMKDNKISLAITESIKKGSKEAWFHSYAINKLRNGKGILLILSLFSGLFEMMVTITKGTSEYELLNVFDYEQIYIDPQLRYVEHISLSKSDTLKVEVKSNKPSN